MPIFLEYVATAVASYFAAAGTAAYALIYAAAYVVTAAAVYEATNLAVNALTDKSGSGSNSMRGLQVAAVDTGYDGVAIYGTVRLAGVNMIDPVTGGDSGRYLEQIVAHSIHEVDSFGPVYVDDVVFSPDGDLHAVTGASTDGQAQDTRLSGKVWARSYRGTTSDAVDYILNNRYPTVFTTDFRGRGWSKTCFTYDYGDGSQWHGLPLPIVEIRGRRCYDPRKDSTNGGSGAHRLADSTTWEWTPNPALGWADHARAPFGGRVSDSAVGWPSVAAAATTCDGLVPVPILLDATNWTNSGTMTITAGTTAQYDFKKTSGSVAWDSYQSTNTTSAGAPTVAEISCSCNSGSMYAMFGFSAVPGSHGNSYVDLVAGFYFNAGNITIYESGVLRGFYGNYVANQTVLTIRWDGFYVWYLVDGRCVRVVAQDVLGVVINQALHFETAIYTVDASAILSVGTQRRFTFGGRFQVSQTDWRNNSKYFIDAMMGRVVKRGAMWYIYAGGWTAPSFSVGKVDWVRIKSIKSSQSRDGGLRWNATHVWYTDPNRNWQRIECTPRTDSAFEIQDGNERIPVPIERPYCQWEFEAQRDGEFQNRKSRNQIIYQGTLFPKFRFIAAGDVGAFTFEELGWSAKLFRVALAQLNSDGSIDVGLVEEQPTDWTDLAASEYNQPSQASIPINNPTTPSAPSSFTAVQNINGTLTFKIGRSVVEPRNTRYRIVRGLTSNNAAVGTVIYDGIVTQVDLTSPTSVNYYWAQAYVNSYLSPYTPNTSGISALASGIDEGQILPGAVSQTVSIFDVTNSQWGATFTAQTVSLLQLNMQTSGNPVALDANFLMNFTQSNAGWMSILSIQWYRDNVAVTNAPAFDGGGTAFATAASSGWTSQLFLGAVDNPSAGVHSYDLRAIWQRGNIPIGPSNFSVSQRLGKAREYKR